MPISSMQDARAPSKRARAAEWTIRILLAFAFLTAGGAKLAAAPPMVAIFHAIGIGQWFRYVTGSIEIIGGALLLWPRRAVYGALVLTCTMIGALLTHALVIGGNWIPAAGLLVLDLILLWLLRATLQNLIKPKA
jgi:putative oxidoreductase